MAISVADRKKLHDRAGGECSFPECHERQGLQEAHIIAKEDGGPRADPSVPKAERDRYENLLMLCPTHHVVVDKQEQEWPVERLLATKSAHEQDVAQRSSVAAASSSVGEPPLATGIIMKVSDSETAAEDYGEPLDVLVRWQTAHRRTVAGEGLMFFTGKLDITNRSGRALSLEPRVVIKRDPHTIPDPKIRQLIEEQKPDAVEASLEIFGLPTLPEKVRGWGAKDVSYFPNPIPVGADQTATGQMAFRLDDQFVPFADTEYRGFDFLLIDLVGGHVAAMRWAHGYPS